MNDNPSLMIQRAPYPTELADLVNRCRYRPGWRLKLEDIQRDGENHEAEASGLTLIITTAGYNSYHPEQGEIYRVHHYFPVPAATYDRRSWQWWLFKQFLLVEQHECMEFFVILDDEELSERPYAPMHGPGNDPYLITVERTESDRKTSFRGEMS